MEKEKRGFDESVARIVKLDPRFHRDAYFFLRDSLDFAVKMLGRDQNLEPNRHVRGQELLEGFRKYAIESFGPMVPTVFEEWGLSRCEDIGDMVFNMIEGGIFGRSAEDCREDFDNGFDFNHAFVTPFLPRAIRITASQVSQTS